MTPADLYDRLATRTFTARDLYLNLGYWKTARTIDEACPALADLVARGVAMGPDDEVVDVGFGFAGQDIMWMRRFAPRRIIGLNVTAAQVRIARHQVRRAGLSDRIDLREGSATAMPLADACCDIVTAVECAFHFDTRAAFFSEALRVLRPGGRLALADVIRADPSPGPRGMLRDIIWGQFARGLSIPPDNADRIVGYRRKLRDAGFDRVAVTSIRDDVFPGWHRALRDDLALRRRLPLAARVLYRFLRRVDADTLYGAFDYVLTIARKPDGESNVTV
jgi:SAM-dependent methyltransferase